MDKAAKTKAWKELTKPFAKSVVKKNPKGFGDYVPHHIYTRRLVDSGLFKSFDTVEVIKAADGFVVGARCTLVVDSPDGEKTVTACGDVDAAAIERARKGNKNPGELTKDGESDALKRCCMRLGIGLELWEQDMSEEEYDAGVVGTQETKKKQVTQETGTSPSNDVPNGSPVADHINNIIETMVDDRGKRLQYQKEAYDMCVEDGLATEVEDWSDEDVTTFLATFQAQMSNTLTDVVEETFGEVIDKSEKVCPDCKKSGNIEDNIEKKNSEPKFSKIPDFACSNYGEDKHGCGKGWWISSADLPTQWL